MVYLSILFIIQHKNALLEGQINNNNDGSNSSDDDSNDDNDKDGDRNIMGIFLLSHLKKYQHT